MPSPDRKFDIETFNKNKDESNYWEFTDNEDIEVVQYSIMNNEYYERKKKPKDLIEEYYAYYENGNLKKEARCFMNNFIGKAYIYDSTGKLTEIIDYDINYKYSLENVLCFVKKHKIDLLHKHTIIKRYEDKKRGYGYCWFIMWQNPRKKGLTVVILSGEDGKILEKRTEYLKM